MHRLVKPLTDKALFMNGEFMMIFGCGDLAISNECNKENDPSRLSFSRLGQEFELPINSYDIESSMFSLGGTFQFSIVEIEVYQVNIKAAQIVSEVPHSSMATSSNGITPGGDMETP